MPDNEAVDVGADEARAEVAFKDFLLMAPKRSVDALLLDYQERSRQLGRGSVPTTNRTTIYGWAKQYRWKERAQEHDRRVAQSDAKSYDALRSLRYDNLFSLSESGVKALQTLIENEKTPPKVRLDAVKTLFDRIGISEKLVEHANTPIKSSNVPEPDADDETIAKWLAEQRR